MSTVKFAAAKDLIDQKRYDAAREILKTIDHPTAREWLANLEIIAPTETYTLTPAPRKKRHLGRGLNLIGGGLLILGVFFFFSLLPQLSGDDEFYFGVLDVILLGIGSAVIAAGVVKRMWKKRQTAVPAT